MYYLVHSLACDSSSTLERKVVYHIEQRRYKGTDEDTESYSYHILIWLFFCVPIKAIGNIVEILLATPVVIIIGRKELRNR